LVQSAPSLKTGYRVTH